MTLGAPPGAIAGAMASDFGSLAAEGGERRSPIFSSQGVILLIVVVIATIGLNFLRARARRDRMRGSGGGSGGPPSRIGSGSGPVVGAGVAVGGSSPPHAVLPATASSRDDGELSKLYIELSEFAREMEGRLDTKMAYLKRLIADAEKVTERLDRSIESAEAIRQGGKAAAAPKAPPGESNPGESKSAPAVGPARVDITVGGPSAAPATPAAAPEPLEGVQARVLALFTAGKPKEAIAEELGLPRGEVELVLSIHRAVQKRLESQSRSA